MSLPPAATILSLPYGFESTYKRSSKSQYFKSPRVYYSIQLTYIRAFIVPLGKTQLPQCRFSGCTFQLFSQSSSKHGFCPVLSFKFNSTVETFCFPCWFKGEPFSLFDPGITERTIPPHHKDLLAAAQHSVTSVSFSTFRLNPLLTVFPTEAMFQTGKALYSWRGLQYISFT